MTRRASSLVLQSVRQHPLQDMSNLGILLGKQISRIEGLAAIGPIDGGGSCRLALTDDDRAGRDLVGAWMDDLGLDGTVDVIGNVVACSTRWR